jgi:phosphoribosylaminoimidazolecarboxamide formyltransferase/IMP cyclohydrolase
MTTRRALLSVSDKTSLRELAARLVSMGFEIVSTGGTARSLREAGVAVRDVSDVTGFPEIMDGRVKTLHPKIHGGILARRGVPGDEAALAAQSITPVDVVAVNLYPFAETVAKGAALDEACEQIDIGGPAMLRASAKNWRHVVVLCDPRDYDRAASALESAEGATDALRLELAAKAFAHTAAYDAMIARHLGRESGADAGPLPEKLVWIAEKTRALRYGENPHQAAAFYRADLATAHGEIGLADGQVLQGKELSYNNLLDLDAANGLALELAHPAAVIVKHTNPCGVARAGSLAEALRIARSCDPVSAFGGVVALTGTVDEATAIALAETFFEVIVAPGFDDAARTVLSKKTNLRLVALPTRAPRTGLDVRSIRGGLLVQTVDRPAREDTGWKVVTKRAPTDAERASLELAWCIAKHVKSNAIVFANAERSLAVGAGQMSRVDSVQIARTKAGAFGTSLVGSAVGSDAFFPFPDGVEAAADAGATAIAQPGGSVRDADVIAAADARGLAMVFTGARHFRH